MPNEIERTREIPVEASMAAIQMITESDGLQPQRAGTGLNVKIYLESYSGIEFLSKLHSEDERASDLSQKFPGIDKYRNEAGMLKIFGDVASKAHYAGVSGDEIIPKLEYRDDQNRIVCVTYCGPKTLSDLMNELTDGERRHGIHENLVDSLVLMSRIGDKAIEDHMPDLRALEALTMQQDEVPLAKKIVESYFLGAVLAAGKREDDIPSADLDLLISSFEELGHYFDGSVPREKEYLTSVISGDSITDNVVFSENGGNVADEPVRPSFRRLKHVDFSHSRIGKLDTETFMFNSSHFGLDHSSIRRYVDKFWYKRLEALGYVNEPLTQPTGGWASLPKPMRKELRLYRYISWIKESLRRVGLRHHFAEQHPDLFKDYMIRLYNLKDESEVAPRNSEFNSWYFGVLRNSLVNLREWNFDETSSLANVDRIFHQHLPLQYKFRGQK